MAVVLILTLLIWSILNHQSFELETEHRSTLEAELPSIVALTRRSSIKGNKVEVGQDGEFFDRLLPDLAAARETIHIETYVWWKGEICKRVAEVLAEKAGEGVEVRLLLDWAGSQQLLPEHATLMEEAGVEIAKFYPPSLRAIGRFNARNNDRKIAVVDGATGYVFGHGFGDEWTGNAQDKKHFRDSALRIRAGREPAAGAFSENWIEETGRSRPTIGTSRPSSRGHDPAHVAYTSPTGSISSVQILYYWPSSRPSARSSSRIRICFPTGRDRAVEEAVGRGVDVKIMVPSDDPPTTPSCSTPATITSARSSSGA